MVSWLVKWGGKKGVKKVYELLTPKIAKNLTSRRKEQDALTTLIDKKYKEAAVKPGKSASKIKKEAVSKSSKIHDKWEKRGWKQSDKDLGK